MFRFLSRRSGDESGKPLVFSEPVYHYRRHFLDMDDDDNDDDEEEDEEEEEDHFPIAPKGTSRRSVWERLTDHQFYTGAHKERFDELGNGRGLAGREYLYLNDGMTESPSRTHEVFSSIIRFPRRPVVEEGYLGIQRFGVQNVTPKLMWLYRNGDKHHSGVAYFLKHHVKTLELFYQDATKIVDPLAGPVRRLYDQNLRIVKRLEDIVDGGKYLCSSGEPPTYLSRLEKFLSQWVVQTL